ncbi:Mitochondrial import receptor subunit TOM70 [Nakaseomyces bracarensis]|uniref:Mitochondrial import receptor subunit TOM70 n=1 Tax=Nakaseomyces bracarensis TaxID=273131 RepID=A0ABR4NUR6_9SACH
MSSNSDSLGGFLVRNKRAVIASVATVSAVAGAYIYYRQLQSLKDDKDETNKKKKEERFDFLVLADGDEPDIEAMKKIEDQILRAKYSTELKNKGNSFFKSKDYANAIKYYEYALQLKEDAIFYSNLATCYMSLNDTDNAMKFCNKALELNPDYSKVLLKRASLNEGTGNFQDALFDLTALSLTGDFNDATIQPIVERVLNKQAMVALKDILERCEKEKVLPSATSMAAFFGVFKPETSIRNYIENDESDKLLVDALNALYGHTREGYNTADELFRKALVGYKLKLEEDKENENLKEKAAIAYEHVGILDFLKNDAISARENVGKALALFPRAKSYVYLGLLVADKGLDEEYYKNFENALALNQDNAAVYYHRGQMGFILQQYEKAGADFDKAKEEDPENIFPYIQLACMAYREGNFADCETLFSEARRKFPDAPEVPNFFAEILSDKGDIEKALLEYDRAIELEGKTDNIRVGIAPLVGKATTLLKNPTVENFIEADELFETAASEDPNADKAKMGLAQCKLQQEDLEEAISLFEETAFLSRTIDEKLQAVTFAEATKVQQNIKADPRLQTKIMKAVDDLRRNGGMPDY